MIQRFLVLSLLLFVALQAQAQDPPNAEIWFVNGTLTANPNADLPPAVEFTSLKKRAGILKFTPDETPEDKGDYLGCRFTDANGKTLRQCWVSNPLVKRIESPANDQGKMQTIEKKFNSAPFIIRCMSVAGAVKVEFLFARNGKISTLSTHDLR